MSKKQYIIPEVIKGKLNKKVEYRNEWCENTRNDLNNKQTQAEKHVFQFLTEENIEFIQNYPVYRTCGQPYYIDFVLPGNIALEIDGNYHSQEKQIKKDKERDEYLISIGYTVIRLSNMKCKTKKSFYNNFNDEYYKNTKVFDETLEYKPSDMFKEEKNWGCILPKKVFELLTENILSEDEFCTYMQLLYIIIENNGVPSNFFNRLISQNYPPGVISALKMTEGIEIVKL